jgi:hypothetical protein
MNFILTFFIMESTSPVRSLSRSRITSLNSPSRLSREAQTQSKDVLHSSNKDSQQLRDRIDVSKRKGEEHLTDATRGYSPAHGALKAPSNRDDDDCSVFTSTTTTSTGAIIINHQPVYRHHVPQYVNCFFVTY